MYIYTHAYTMFWDVCVYTKVYTMLWDVCTHVYSCKCIHMHNALGGVYIYGRPAFLGMYTQVNNALVCVYTSIHDALGGV